MSAATVCSGETSVTPSRTSTAAAKFEVIVAVRVSGWPTVAVAGPVKLRTEVVKPARAGAGPSNSAQIIAPAISRLTRMVRVTIYLFRFKAGERAFDRALDVRAVAMRPPGRVSPRCANDFE